MHADYFVSEQISLTSFTLESLEGRARINNMPLIQKKYVRRMRRRKLVIFFLIQCLEFN